MPLVTMLGLVGNILSILVLRSPRIDMKVVMIREMMLVKDNDGITWKSMN